MFDRILCHGELHMFGGDGTVYMADFRKIRGELIDKYAGSARVVYIDPPFNTGGSFEYRRGKKRLAYSDSLPREEYLALIREAAELSRELLAEDGTFFIHIDYRMSHHIRLICDEVFGEDMLANEIVWTYRSGGRATNSFSKKHDTIFMYRRSEGAYFDIDAVGVARGPERRNHMKRAVDEDGRVYYSIRMGGREYRYYEDDKIYPSDVWDDIEHLHQRDPERTGYLTQKPEALLRRIIRSCSKEGDLVVDLFGGSGTTAAAAAEEGRRFVSVDSGACALAVTRRRLIERCLKLSLFDTVSPLSVEFEDGADCGFGPEEYFDISEKNGRAVLTLKKLPAEKLPDYAAAGVVSEGIFTAHDYMLRFKPGESLALKPGEALHLVDEDMKQGFYVFS